MRPVNLIPTEQRRDKRTSVRGAGVAYMLVGALALGLIGVTLVVLTNNKVSDRKAEIVELKNRQAEAQARSDALAPFASFASLEQSRTATVKSLANSRFDWERVLRELALVIPADVWLTELSGAASNADPAAAAAGAAGGTSSGAAAPSGVPSLILLGCGADQESVAGFLAALRDIDGVTRVGLSISERRTSDQGSSSSPDAGDADCRTRDPIPKFEIVVAFDAVPPPAVPGAAPVAPADAAAAAAAAAPAGGAPPSTETAPAANTGS